MTSRVIKQDLLKINPSNHLDSSSLSIFRWTPPWIRDFPQPSRQWLKETHEPQSLPTCRWRMGQMGLGRLLGYFSFMMFYVGKRISQTIPQSSAFLFQHSVMGGLFMTLIYRRYFVIFSMTGTWKCAIVAQCTCTTLDHLVDTIKINILESCVVVMCQPAKDVLFAG